MTTLTLCVIKIGGIGGEKSKERSKKQQHLNRCASLMDEAGEGEMINPKEQWLLFHAHKNPLEGKEGSGQQSKHRTTGRVGASPVLLKPSVCLLSSVHCQTPQTFLVVCMPCWSNASGTACGGTSLR